jgi:Fe-S cluster biogenesis protein NfuA
MHTDDSDFQSRIAQLESVIQEIESTTDPTTRTKTRQLVQTLLEYHGASLAKILEFASASSKGGQSLLDSMVNDDLVASVLLLHGLHPHDLRTRVLRALDRVRPKLASHGGNVELIELTSDGGVRLRLEGSCHGCASSRETLRYLIEDAVYATAPDLTSLDVEGVTEEPSPLPPTGFIPISNLTVGSNRALAGSGS